MQVGEIIQRVQSLYSKGAQSDDTRLMSRHIYNKMLSARSLLVYNKINKKQFMSKWMYTVLPCVELIEVSGNDCPCVPAPGCTVLRTKYKLPKPMSSINNYIIDSVMSIDGSIIFTEVTYISQKWKSGDKYTSNRPSYFIKDDYLYITHTKKLKAITITGLFADPIEAENYPSVCNEGSGETDCPSNPRDTEFPIDDEMVDMLVEMTVKELGVGFNMGQEDRRNDSIDKPQQLGEAPRRQRR